MKYILLFLLAFNATAHCECHHKKQKEGGDYKAYKRGAMFSCAYTLLELKGKRMLNRKFDSYTYCRYMSKKIADKLFISDKKERKRTLEP